MTLTGFVGSEGTDPAASGLSPARWGGWQMQERQAGVWGGWCAVALPLTAFSLPFSGRFSVGDSTGCQAERSRHVCHRADVYVHVPGDKYTNVNVRKNVNIYNNFPQLRVVLEQKISILGVGTSIL